MTVERVLVIVLAETREHEHTYELFQKNMLDVVGGDLALCVANNEREDASNPFYQHAKYVWAYDEPDDWGDAFDYIQRRKAGDADWRQLLGIKDQWLGGVKGEGEHEGSAGILLFFRVFLKQCLEEDGLIEEYDRFIVTRSDFVHRAPHVPLGLLDPKYVWIPNGEDYGGYTDRHVVASARDILNVLGIADRVVMEPAALYQDMQLSAEWNLEMFIKFSLERDGVAARVKRYPYTMYSVRSKDGHTRWEMGEFSKKLGYSIKYPSEYRGAVLATRLVKRPGDWNRFRIFMFNWLKALVEVGFVRIFFKVLFRP